MADGEVVQLGRDTFAAGCGCLVWAGLLCGTLGVAVAVWLRGLLAAAGVAAVVLLGVAVLMVGRWFWERSDAEARAICLCGLTRSPEGVAAGRGAS